MADNSLVFNIFRFSYYGVFVGLHIALQAGVFLERLRERKALKISIGELPAVSVIIPVHNESHRIERLLKSLEAQNYPQAEFIFVDDRSRDGSAEMIAEFIRRMGSDKLPARMPSVRIPPVKLISLKDNPGPNFKQHALAQGIEVSTGEFILFTDADCEIPPHWIEGMVKRMSDEKVGAAIGPVLKRYDKKDFFHLYQCYEHGVRYVYLAGSAGLGAAGGGFGNNMILRRASLDAVGGYEKVPLSPTEDAALVSRIRSCSNYKIRAALGSDVHVITEGEDTWINFINQTLRWNNGGIFSPDPATRFNYNFLMITITMGVLAFPLLPFIPSIWPLPLGPFTVMVFNTIANLGLFGVSLPRRNFNFGYMLTLLFTPVYFALMTILGFLGVKPKWKGEKV